MTALQTVPAGVARILTKRSEAAIAAARLAVQVASGRIVQYPHDRAIGMESLLIEHRRAQMALELTPSAEKLAQEWLDGLERMALVPMEGAL